VEKELDILSSLKHPNIVKLIEIRENEDYIKKNGSSYKVLAIILELVVGGDLFEYIAITGRFCEEVARTYFKMLIETLEYCHSQGIAHRDLKPENVLLDDEFNIKLTDFGLSTFLCGRDNDNKLYSCNGTELYMAPEMHVGEAYSGASIDIFACGVILFVMISGHPPFCKADPRCDGFYKCFCIEENDKFWIRHEQNKPKQPNQDFYSTEFKNLINGMINPDSSERLTLAQVRDHPWYNGPTTVLKELKSEFAQRKQSVDQEFEKRRQEKKRIKRVMCRQSSKGIKPYRVIEKKLCERERHRNMRTVHDSNRPSKCLV